MRTYGLWIQGNTIVHHCTLQSWAILTLRIELLIRSSIHSGSEYFRWRLVISYELGNIAFTTRMAAIFLSNWLNERFLKICCQLWGFGRDPISSKCPCFHPLRYQGSGPVLSAEICDFKGIAQKSEMLMTSNLLLVAKSHYFPDHWSNHIICVTCEW